MVETFQPIDALQYTGEAQRLAFRANCLGSLFYFIRVALRRIRLTQNLHMPVCKSLERSRLKDVYEMPRDHFKSTICTEGLPMWWALPCNDTDLALFRALGYSDEFLRWLKAIHDPDSRILLVSENITNAAKLGSRVRWHFESNSIYRHLFPETLPDGSCNWSNYSLQVKRSGAGHGEGTFDFLGVGGALQSRHYNRAIIQDDLVGRKAIESPTVMEKTIEYHKLLVGAFDQDDATHENNELVVGNRWSFHDLNSHIREHEPWFNITLHSALGGCCQVHPADKPIFPEEFSVEKLAKFRDRLGAYHFSCFVAGTPVLMSNFTEKNIEELTVGDEIVGYDAKRTGGLYPGLKKATVQFVNKRVAQVVKVTMRTGRTFICTPDHKFLKSVAQHRERNTYAPLSIGMDLCSVYEPPKKLVADEQRDFDWLGGILDGEGSCGVIGQTSISQSIALNHEVHTEISSVLHRLGIGFEWVGAADQFMLHGGRSLKVRLLSYARMAKRQRFIDSIWRRRKRVSEYIDVVEKIEPLGEMEVFNIQSSSGNYVAAGYATKNCQFLNNPAAPDNADFQADWLNYFTLLKDSQNRYVITHEVKNGQVRPDLRVGHMSIAMAVDPNHAGNAAGGRCRHAVVVVGRHKDDFYLLDYWAAHGTYDALVAEIYKMADKWHLTRFGLETCAGQRYLGYHIAYRNKIENRTLKYIPLDGEVEAPDGTLTHKKEWRIRNILSPLFEQQRFFVRRDKVEFYGEYIAFPRGRYVDILDALAYTPQLLRYGSSPATDILMRQNNQRLANRINTPYSAGAVN